MHSIANIKFHKMFTLQLEQCSN